MKKSLGYNRIYDRKQSVLTIAFLFFCFCPFVFPNRLLVTDIQLYYILVGSIVLIKSALKNWKIRISYKADLVLFITFFITLLLFFLSGITFNGLRGVANYFGALVVFLAWKNIFKQEDVSENLQKTLILVWFVVGFIQLFINRTAFMSFVSGARYSFSYRGCCGLASEPSFYGIMSFFFLHLAIQFRKNKLFFIVIITIMGVFFAQSMLGAIFISMFFVGYAVDNIDSIKGKIAIILGILLFYIMIEYAIRYGQDTRIGQLVGTLYKDGIASILKDESASIRGKSILNALKQSYKNYFLPGLFSKRIGSLIGGILCELGFLGLPFIYIILRGFSLTFNHKSTQVLYFIICAFLFLSTSQIGHPCMWTVIAFNYMRVYKEVDDER